MPPWVWGQISAATRESFITADLNLNWFSRGQFSQKGLLTARTRKSVARNAVNLGKQSGVVQTV